MLSMLTYFGEAVLWGWLLLKRMADAIVGFAGFPEHDEDEPQVPAWLGWFFWFFAVAALLGTALFLAIHG